MGQYRPQAGVTFHLRQLPAASADLLDLHIWIAAEAGDETADAYLRRVISKLETLVDFPDRGTPRAEWGDGIRSVTFERRLIIAYRVEGDEVLILRVVAGARDLGSVFD